MNKKKSFGSSDSFIIFDTVIKQKIIDYLYTSLNLSKHRYIMLNNISKLEFLRDNEHYISPCFKGYNYFLLFINLDDGNHGKKKYCIAIDRKKLSYHKDQVDLKTVFMVKINVKVSDSIFCGTIFDGKLIESSNKFIFLIQDCFYLMGKNILDMDMFQKMEYLDNIIKIHFIDNNVCENFNFKLNKLYKYDNLLELIENIIPACSIPNQGLVFYPKTSGVSVIHIEKKLDKVNITSSDNIIENKSYDMIYNFVEFIKTRRYSYEQGNKTRVFWLSKSNIPDVYNYSETENGERLGIVYIPNIRISHLCDENISEKSFTKFNCVYHTKFKKWIPINLV